VRLRANGTEETVASREYKARLSYLDSLGFREHRMELTKGQSFWVSEAQPKAHRASAGSRVQPACPPSSSPGAAKHPRTWMES
jgi:hypothetical protein